MSAADKMSCDLRDGRATAPESCGESFLEEVSLFNQGPEIQIGWNAGGVGGMGHRDHCWPERDVVVEKGQWCWCSCQPHSIRLLPSDTHTAPLSNTRALTCPVFSPGAARPFNVPSPGSRLARCHHLSIQRSLSTHYILRTLLGIQSYIVKIHSPCSPRASGHFQAKVTSSVNQPFTSVSPTSLIPSSIFTDSVWV